MGNRARAGVPAQLDTREHESASWRWAACASASEFYDPPLEHERKHYHAVCRKIRACAPKLLLFIS